MGNEHQIKKKAKSAFIIWGTRDYRNETYTGAEPEYNASRDVCSKIYDVVANSQEYTYCKNFWGFCFQDTSSCMAFMDSGSDLRDALQAIWHSPAHLQKAC